MIKLPTAISNFNKEYDKFFDGTSLIMENHPTFGTRPLAYDGAQDLFEFWNCMDYLLNEYQDKTLSFLEIGAAKGLWAYTLLAHMELYNINLKYTTITMVDENPVNQYLFKVQKLYMDNGIPFTLIDNTSFDPTNLDKLDSEYDVVFIDADHSYDAVMSDIKLYSGLATSHLLFHDIRPIDGGVYRAIEANKIPLDIRYINNEKIMGIGVCVL